MSRNTLKLDTSGFEQYLTRLYRLEHMNSKVVVEKLLGEVSDKISADTEAALAESNLPAQGRYSQGDTKKSIVKNAKPEWQGMVCLIPIGFDFSVVGAGGYLITGTPKMQPDKALNRMYKQKKYANEITKMVGDKLLDYIVEKEMAE